jgi:hypothetical protein
LAAGQLVFVGQVVGRARLLDVPVEELAIAFAQQQPMTVRRSGVGIGSLVDVSSTPELAARVGGEISEHAQ